MFTCTCQLIEETYHYHLSSSHGLSLGAKQKLVVDFLIGFPVALTQSANKESVCEGFNKAGMIDSLTRKWPDFRGILNTSSVKFTDKQIQHVKSTFATMHTGQLKKGQIVETVFDDLEYDSDTYVNPSDAVNRNTDTESRQRAKTLNCEWQHDNRMRIKQELKRQSQLKLLRYNDKVSKVLHENETCEVRLKAIFNDLEAHKDEISAIDDKQKVKRWKKLSVVNVPIAIAEDFTRHKESMSMPIFESFKLDLLRSFCISRSLTYDQYKLRSSAKKIPNIKGPLTKLSVSLCNVVVKLIPPSAEAESDSYSPPELQLGITEPIIVITVKASSFLEKSSWLESFRKGVCGIVSIDSELMVSNEQKRDADALLEILMQRFEDHFISHNMSEKREYQCFKWAFSNLPRVSAAMVMATHTRNNLHSLKIDRNVTLLANPESSITSTFINARTEESKNLEGCYLYYNTEDGKWIRSGKAGGDGNGNFGKRDEEHKKSASKPKPSSLFYMSYPHRTSASKCARGTWEDLEQYCALAFKSDNAGEFTEKETGLLEWDRLTTEWMTRTSEGKRSIKSMQLMMVAYLIELCYELCISSVDNISESGGFEGLSGTFAK